MQREPGIVDVDISAEDDQERLVFRTDKAKAALSGVSTENIVALCDVDDLKMAQALKRAREYAQESGLDESRLDKAPKYKDFRVMLEKEKSIDAVTVSTPDHTHAVVAVMAMSMGKHCFVQKPLTHSVKEARVLREVAR